jgi:hypothetical protein
MQRVFLQAALAILMTGAAVAQDAESPLIDLAACRLDDASVRLSFSFESSPCWETTDPVVTNGSGEPAGAGVAIGMVATSEICTMNIVIAEFDNALPIAAPVNAIDLTVTTPDGAILGETTVAVAEPGPTCTPPTKETEIAAQ